MTLEKSQYMIFGLIFVVLAGILLYTFIPNMQPTKQEAAPVYKQKTLAINGQQIRVDVADTPALRERGLSGRQLLAEGQGMLFVFPVSGRPGFWMKDMRFPIDILWISSSGLIADMTADLSPSTFPTVFSSTADIQYVLEVPAGTVQKFGFRKGMRAEGL